MADKIDLNALGQAIDTTWGRSSTPQTASYSVKFNIAGNQLLVSYIAVVNFGTERQMIEMKRRYVEESVSVINAALKGVKERYKSLVDSSLTVKEIGSSDSLEIINGNFHNPKRTAYYRRKTAFEVG